MRKSIEFLIFLSLIFLFSNCTYASEENECQKTIRVFFESLAGGDYVKAYDMIAKNVQRDAGLLNSEIKPRRESFANQFKTPGYKTFSMMGLDYNLKVGSAGREIGIPFAGVSKVIVAEMKIFEKNIQDKGHKSARALVRLEYPPRKGPVMIDKINVKFTYNPNVVIKPVKPIPMYARTIFSADHSFPSSPGKFNGYDIYFPQGKKVASSFEGIVTLVKDSSIGNKWLIETFPTTWRDKNFDWR